MLAGRYFYETPGKEAKSKALHSNVTGEIAFPISPISMPHRMIGLEVSSDDVWSDGKMDISSRVDWTFLDKAGTPAKTVIGNTEQSVYSLCEDGACLLAGCFLPPNLAASPEPPGPAKRIFHFRHAGRQNSPKAPPPADRSVLPVEVQVEFVTLPQAELMPLTANLAGMLDGDVFRNALRPLEVAGKAWVSASGSLITYSGGRADLKSGFEWETPKSFSPASVATGVREGKLELVPVPPKVAESDEERIGCVFELDPAVGEAFDTIALWGTLTLNRTGTPVRMGEGFGSVNVETRCSQQLSISQTLRPGCYHLAGIGPAIDALGKASGNDGGGLRTVIFVKALLPDGPKPASPISAKPHIGNILMVKDWLEVDQADALRILADPKFHHNEHEAFLECQRLIKEDKAHHLHTSAIVTNSGQRVSLNSVWKYPSIQRKHGADWLQPMPPGTALATQSNLFGAPVTVDELWMMEVGERFEMDPVLSEDRQWVDANLSDTICSLVGANRNPIDNFEDPIFRKTKLSTALTFGIGQCQIVGSHNASRVGKISGFTPSTKRILRFVRVLVDAPPLSFPPKIQEAELDGEGDPFATPSRK
jgi:hypothetical protein